MLAAAAAAERTQAREEGVLLRLLLLPEEGSGPAAAELWEGSFAFWGWGRLAEVLLRMSWA